MSLHHWVCVNYSISPYGKHVGWNTSRVDLSQSFFLAFSASPLSPPFFAHFILITTLCWTCNHVSWLPGPLICAISPPISVIKTGVWNQSCVCVFTSTLRGWSGVSSGRGQCCMWPCSYRIFEPGTRYDASRHRGKWVQRICVRLQLFCTPVCTLIIASVPLQLPCNCVLHCSCTV